MKQPTVSRVLKESKIHIALPCYGGQISEATFSSLLRFTIRCVKLGINVAIDTLPNESLITRARNNLAARMLADPQATHIMFIDADIGFDGEALAHLLAVDDDKVASLETFYKKLWARPTPDTPVRLTVLQGADIKTVVVLPQNRLQNLRKPSGI